MKRLWMAAIIIVVGGFFLMSHEPVAAGQTEHIVPVEKSLNRGTIRMLIDRGRPDTYTGKDLETIGMPIGGIATGQLYLRGDGTLAIWQISNRHVFTGYGRDNYRAYRPDSPVNSGFALTRETATGTTIELLDKTFSNIQFTGEYPIARCFLPAWGRIPRSPNDP